MIFKISHSIYIGYLWPPFNRILSALGHQPQKYSIVVIMFTLANKCTGCRRTEKARQQVKQRVGSEIDARKLVE